MKSKVLIANAIHIRHNAAHFNPLYLILIRAISQVRENPSSLAIKGELQSLKFVSRKVLCSENKGADQLRGLRGADLCHAKIGFPHDAVLIYSLPKV